MSQPSTHVIHGSTQVPPPKEWITFELMEPKLGPQAFGEVSYARKFGTSGNLTSGYWWTVPGSPGINVGGFGKNIYSSPLGDETACVIDGSVSR